MGQTSSNFNNKSTRRSFSAFSRRGKANKSNLSHTFSLSSCNNYTDLININTASEEQLMTLPGVNRAVAQAIVEHRLAIGRFKRVDDLALVSGIGAARLEAMRPEICIKKMSSYNNSCNQSVDSFRFNGDNSYRLLNVNSASVFQLQCIPGLNQEIAANIIDYRNKKGPFRSLEDLIKVRGIDILRLSSIKSYLSIESIATESSCSIPRVNDLKICNTLEIQENGSSNNGHRKTSSAPIKYSASLGNGFAYVPVNDIFDLLSTYSQRPTLIEEFNFERNGIKCCRVASWNLHHLTLDKVNNPGFLEVVCRTILENRWSVVLLQDIWDETAPRLICDQLNSPTLRRVKEWSSNSRLWNYTTTGLPNNKKSLGCIFESKFLDNSIECLSLERETDENLNTIKEYNKLLEFVRLLNNEICELSISMLKVCDIYYLVMNIQLRGQITKVTNDILHKLVKECHIGVGKYILAGEFFSIDNVKELLTLSGENILGMDSQTRLENECGQSSLFVDESVKYCKYGIVKSGLHHLAIPKGWTWGGTASPFAPAWFELLLL